MAISTNGTKLADLINPQVMADVIESKLVDAIRFAPLATIDYTLQGRAGNTVTLPSFAYIGDAETVAEGADVPIRKLTASDKEVTIHKLGNGVELSDEAVLSGYGNPVEEATNQLVVSIASAVDNELLVALNGVSSERTVSASSIPTADEIGDALVKYGEDIDGEKAALVSPETYKNLRNAKDWCPASEIAANILIKGAIGMAHGCQILVSNKLADTNNAFIVKPGALRIFTKRDTVVESDRDIVSKTTVITADKHFAPYVYDESKVIKIAAGAGA
jgi:N4-gp56 family major capsid protein